MQSGGLDASATPQPDDFVGGEEGGPDPGQLIRLDQLMGPVSINQTAKTSKRRLGNLAAFGIDQVAAIVRTRLQSIHYRPTLIDAFITETGLVIRPQPP